MKLPLNAFTDGIEALLRLEHIKTVSVFVPPMADCKMRVRLTRVGRNEIRITYGKPNYAEREFLTLCKKAKCKPRRLWLKPFPKKK